MNKRMFDHTVAGMSTLYDSEAFIVVHLQSNPAVTEHDATQLHGRNHMALARHGFEIVDKRSGRRVYLDGRWAELFQEQISAWHNTTPTQEEVEDTLDNYAGLASNPVMLH